MKMLSITATLAVLAAIVLTRAVGADGPNRPPGVGATEWMPISDTLGIVLTQPIPPVGDVIAPKDPAFRNPQPGTRFEAAGGAALVPPTNGYFMVKRGSRWGRLVIIEPLKGPGDTG